MNIDQKAIVTFIADSLTAMVDTSKAGAPHVFVTGNTIELAPSCRAGLCIEVREDLSIRVDGKRWEGEQYEAAVELWRVSRNWHGLSFPAPLEG